jgi:hypothetical protein
MKNYQLCLLKCERFPVSSRLTYVVEIAARLGLCYDDEAVQILEFLLERVDLIVGLLEHVVEVADALLVGCSAFELLGSLLELVLLVDFVAQEVAHFLEFLVQRELCEFMRQRVFFDEFFKVVVGEDLLEKKNETDENPC